jgi:hypothetical protein
MTRYYSTRRFVYVLLNEVCSIEWQDNERTIDWNESDAIYIHIYKGKGKVHHRTGHDGPDGE